MTNRAHVLLWTDQTATYLDAIKAAGLADRVSVETLPRKDKPSAEQLARTEALMAGGVPAGLLPSMPKLRWAQAKPMPRLPPVMRTVLPASFRSMSVSFFLSSPPLGGEVGRGGYRQSSRPPLLTSPPSGGEEYELWAIANT